VSCTSARLLLLSETQLAGLWCWYCGGHLEDHHSGMPGKLVRGLWLGRVTPDWISIIEDERIEYWGKTIWRFTILVLTLMLVRSSHLSSDYVLMKARLSKDRSSTYVMTLQNNAYTLQTASDVRIILGLEIFSFLPGPSCSWHPRRRQMIKKLPYDGLNHTLEYMVTHVSLVCNCGRELEFEFRHFS